MVLGSPAKYRGCCLFSMKKWRVAGVVLRFASRVTSAPLGIGSLPLVLFFFTRSAPLGMCVGRRRELEQRG